MGPDGNSAFISRGMGRGREVGRDADGTDERSAAIVLHFIWMLVFISTQNGSKAGVQRDGLRQIRDGPFCCPPIPEERSLIVVSTITHKPTGNGRKVVFVLRSLPNLHARLN